MAGFSLDERLAKDTTLLMKLGLCQLRLMHDSRWPWVLLVPQRAGISEIFDLTPLDQTMLTFETSIAAKAVKQATDCHKINVGALGNQVRQFHLHIIARNETDPAWPWPVWGHGTALPWEAGAQAEFTNRLLQAL
ncbi:Diadenosine tetraphosphate (Ap4A) hydrolase and other HIT family hydrolase [Hoeflea phototrophica DFL-43]|jgi:diadenosine tetraphosphate (Ap4A) HIT family hydrolase|uniref:Diadenosine tetraphosphate (Ap4A) hydrolase and other HIT family hydrolase n=1 Tax=Hoeflea phototrophica (strain DSM 17068 / NCIMB 14078 / DFL-43) TaxID=411684 RepID=A9CVV6_HOEPD|nr:HIT family protein [Hoeflea phototrophica]EDQ35430.1 Diadenosine tetraphosphate (Ap4A) hydrolase and other HIT family hydrolase [Hoeflea phototrophica DFL-43]